MCTFKNATSTFPLPITRHHNGARSNSSCSNRDRGFAEKFSNEETSARSALLCDKRSRDYGRSDYSQSESGRVPAAPFVMRVCLINSHRIYSVTIIREQRGHEYDEHEEKASVAVSWRAPRAQRYSTSICVRVRIILEKTRTLAEPLRDRLSRDTFFRPFMHT